MQNFTVADGASIHTSGTPAKKNPPTLYYAAQDQAFTVTLTTGAIQYGQTGDLVGFDPTTGNVFLMKKAYFDANFTVVAP
jgi:hypothetical protein